MTTITKSIVFKWKLQFAENYQWTTLNELYNTKTMRKIKKTVNGYSIGYWIDKKFIKRSVKPIHRFSVDGM